MNAIVQHNGQEFRQSTDAAGLCRDIVTKTASNIQGRKYVSVEGWQAIAIAHGCAAGSRDVQKVEGGVRAIGEVRRMDDGQVIATAEGFVGEDEPTWYGGNNGRGRTLPKRPDYAIRAMAQTRAISRACRSAFAHVVVMIDAGLSTTPAEEVPDGGFLEGQFQEVQGQVSPEEPATPTESEGKAKGWREPASIYSTPTKLHAGLARLERELHGCGDTETLDCLTLTEEWTEFVKIAEEHSPHYLYGGEPAPEEFVGLLTKAQRMRDEFQLEVANGTADLART